MFSLRKPYYFKYFCFARFGFRQPHRAPPGPLRMLEMMKRPHPRSFSSIPVPLPLFFRKQVSWGAARQAKIDENIRESASKTRSPEFFGIRMRDGTPHPAVLAPGPVREYHMYNPPLFSVSNIQYIHTSRGGGLEGVGYFLLRIP